MNKKTKSTMLKAVGGTLAVASAAALASSKNTTAKSTKKAMKSAVDKMADFVDTVTAIM